MGPREGRGEDMDDRHIREVYAVSYPRLVTQMVALCGNRAEAEDLVQEAFMTALTHRRDFEEVANKEAWLRTVALNRLRKQWRRAAVVRKVMPRLAQEAPPQLGAGATPDHIAIVTALGQVSHAMRETFVLHYIADLPVSQIAAELEVPEGTVKARLSRCRVQLAGLLSDPEGAEHA